MDVYLKKTSENAKIPTKGSVGAAGYDLCALLPDGYDECVIEPGQTYRVGTGIAAAIPHGCFGAVFARSGLATKKGLRPANCVGVIDSDYRGEIIVALHNDTDERQRFFNGDRIAQLVIMPCFNVDFIETDDLDATERGDGGFGSTGSSGFIPGIGDVIYTDVKDDCKQMGLFNSDGTPIYYIELEQ